MNREPSTHPGQTWEFFSACIHYLGKASLTSLFQRGERQIERWSADPATSGSQKNPLDRYEDLLQKMMDVNERGIAKAIVARQAHITGCELIDKKMPQPDKETVELEIIDDMQVKTVYNDILLNPKATQEECRNAMEISIRELKENYVRKCLDNNWTP